MGCVFCPTLLLLFRLGQRDADVAGPLADREGAAHGARPPAHGARDRSPAPSTRASTTTRRLRLTSRSFDAFAMADRMTLRIIGAARRGSNSRIWSASWTGLPRTRSMTGRALYGLMRAPRCDAVKVFAIARPLPLAAPEWRAEQARRARTRRACARPCPRSRTRGRRPCRCGRGRCGPTNSGTMSQRRDQVLRASLRPVCSMLHDAAEQALVDERALLETARHRLPPDLLAALATADDQTARGLARLAGVAALGRTCPTWRRG